MQKHQRNIGIKFRNVYKVTRGDQITYSILKKREIDPVCNIDFKMPTYRQHLKFMSGKPYKIWYLIIYKNEFIGSINLTKKDEIGIFIFREYRNRLFGYSTLKSFIKTIKQRPLYAAINIANTISMKLFKKCGFKILHENELYIKLIKRTK